MMDLNFIIHYIYYLSSFFLLSDSVLLLPLRLKSKCLPSNHCLYTLAFLLLLGQRAFLALFPARQDRRKMSGRLGGK